jgi:hypothetical protein
MRNLRFLLLIALMMLSLIPAYADGDTSSDSDSLVVSNYVAWWAHDDLGYHPAVAFLYQNESGEDIPEIKFQARFMDVRNNYLSVTRDTRPHLERNAQRHDTVMGNESYELSIDTKSWPQIECKILYKIADEPEAHQLLLARVEQITMTGEEAVQRLLSQAPARRVKGKTGKRKHKIEPVDTSTASHDNPPPAAPAPEAPLSAGSALSLTAKNNGNNGNNAGNNSSTKNKETKESRESKKTIVDKRADSGWHFKSAAGVSDDFFDFEQAYGRPVTYEAAPSKWTWAKYQPGELEIYAGAKSGSSKVDVVVAFVRSKKPLPESQLIALGKEFIAKYKSQLLGAPVRTVRYLPGGRVQQTNLSAAAFHFTIYATNDSADDNRYYVALSRVPGSSDATLLDQAKKSKLLRFMLPIMGDAVEQQ